MIHNCFYAGRPAIYFTRPIMVTPKEKRFVYLFYLNLPATRVAWSACLLCLCYGPQTTLLVSFFTIFSITLPLYQNEYTHYHRWMKFEHEKYVKVVCGRPGKPEGGNFWHKKKSLGSQEVKPTHTRTQVQIHMGSRKSE